MSDLPPAYAVPLEAVAHGADAAGMAKLMELTGIRADVARIATVERCADGRWLATVFYTSPGTRIGLCAHVGLLWAATPSTPA